MAYDYQSRQKLVEAYRAKWKRKLLLVPGEIKEAAEESLQPFFDCFIIINSTECSLCQEVDF